MKSKYETYESESEGGYNNVEMRMSQRASLIGEFASAFGNDSEYGQSLGVTMENVMLEDGCIYYYPNGDRYKLFSWKDVTGLSAEQRFSRDDMDDPEADDADLIHTDSYSDGSYELVAARVPDLVDESGDVVHEASSKVRHVTGMDGETPQFSDFEDLEGERVPFENTVTWYNGSTEYGPTSAAKTMLETLTIFGSESVVDGDDIFNWMPDVTGENILRDDLKGRKVEFFIVPKKSSNGYTYNNPVILDLATGQRIGPNNRGGAATSDGGSSDDSESDAMRDAKAADDDARSYPEPVADFISSGRNLNLDRDRANKLLDDLLADGGNSLTSALVQESGGRDHIIEQVI